MSEENNDMITEDPVEDGSEQPAPISVDEASGDASEEVDEQDFAQMETPEELRAPSEPALAVTHEDFVLPPALERVRPPRPPLVPTWAWVSIAAFVGFLLIGSVLAFIISESSRVAVPGVIGTDVDVARTRLEQAGLVVAITEERFSPKPEGEVLDQDPAAGARAKKGDTVSLVVSAGTEEFAMPDVVGTGISLARSTLEAKGLILEVEEVTSDQASDTVLATIPAPGVLVRIGDTVRVQVASPRPPTSSLQPYTLTGLVIAIDPAPSPEEGADVALDVARRLRAMFEASGATVHVLRSGSETGTADADRAQAAMESSASVAIGLAVQGSGTGGRSVASPATGAAAGASIGLRDELVSQLTTTAPPAVAATTNDVVLGGLTAPWVRVILGSYSTRADETSFADPRWSDEIARAIYSSVGEVFGNREGQ